MSSAPTLIRLDDAFRRDFDELGVDWQPSEVPAPELLVLNKPLALELGLDPEALASPDGVAILAGNTVPEHSNPIAMAYSGHQFGSYSPRLGDGRALLLGEIVDDAGNRWDLHLKGSGRTPYARGGDGKAALGPMLREYVIAEAMHALGVPTTRSLAVLATGEQVLRTSQVPGGILARIASSHIRIGTFEYAARIGPDLVRRLANHAISRHHPGAAEADNHYLALLEMVCATQASLVGKWMGIGFIHGVMNTDNMTISGETIDYGPCAFLDRYDPRTVFSSIDHGGRYAYGNQPAVAQWNLGRLAETLLPLIDSDIEAAVEKAKAVLDDFPSMIRAAWHGGMATKLGLGSPDVPTAETVTLINQYLHLLATDSVDYTSSFRNLAETLRNGAQGETLSASPEMAEWIDQWRQALEAAKGPDFDPTEVANAMDEVNPIYIPRNHLVEEALEAADTGDYEPFYDLVERVTNPYQHLDSADRYALAASPEFSASYQTFCGT